MVPDDVVRAVVRNPDRGELYERVICAAYTGVLVRGDLAIDGGAALGLHTIPMSRAVGEAGIVIAFEALRHIALLLRQRLAARGVANVRVVPKALSDCTGFVEFHHATNDFAYSGIRPRMRYPFQPKFEIRQVRATTIDEALAEHDRWRVAKLDLEGGEFAALRGAAKSIARHRPLLIFENGREHSALAYGYTSADWFGFFAELGYVVFDLFGGELTAERWGDERAGYNFFAAPRGTQLHELVAEEVPRLLVRAASGARQ